MPSEPAGQRPPYRSYSPHVRASGQPPPVGVADGLAVGEADGEAVGLGEIVGENEAVGDGVGLAAGDATQGSGPTVGLGELGSPDGNGPPPRPTVEEPGRAGSGSVNSLGTVRFPESTSTGSGPTCTLRWQAASTSAAARAIAARRLAEELTACRSSASAHPSDTTPAPQGHPPARGSAGYGCPLRPTSSTPWGRTARPRRHGQDPAHDPTHG